MQINHQDNSKKGRFYIEKNGTLLAEMVYVWAGDKIIIEHTDVDAALKGQGIGKQLVQKAVEFARQKQIKIIPLCPFARSVFNKVPAYRDVLF